MPPLPCACFPTSPPSWKPGPNGVGWIINLISNTPRGGMEDGEFLEAREDIVALEKGYKVTHKETRKV